MNRLAFLVITGLLIADFSVELAQGGTSINGSTSAPNSNPVAKLESVSASKVMAAATVGPMTVANSVTNGASIDRTSVTAMPTGNIAPSSATPVQIQSAPVPKSEAKSYLTASPTLAPSLGTVDPLVGQQIVNSLIKSLAPPAPFGGAVPGSNPLGSFGLLPSFSRLSGPLSHLITSNGTPSADDVNQILQVVPDMAVMASMSKMFGAGAGAQSTNGQQPAGTPSSFTNMTQQQINDMISGVAPLPPMSSLPQEYVNTVLSGGVLPGLTMDQTQALKARYMQQMFGGGGLDSLFGHPGGSVPAPASSPSNGSAPATQIIPAINTNQSMNGNQSTPQSILSGIAIQELQKLDLSRLTPEVLQRIMKGETPDLSKIPQDFLQALISKSPQLFASIVSAELQKKMANRSSSAQRNLSSISGGSVPSSTNSDQQPINGKSAPYDVNSLDRKADISMYHQEEDDYRAAIYTAIVLGVVGLLTVVLISVLCWRRHRKNRRLQEAAATGVEQV